MIAHTVVTLCWISDENEQYKRNIKKKLNNNKKRAFAIRSFGVAHTVINCRSFCLKRSLSKTGKKTREKNVFFNNEMPLTHSMEFNRRAISAGRARQLLAASFFIKQLKFIQVVIHRRFNLRLLKPKSATFIYCAHFFMSLVMSIIIL